jgi:hypothetical protein
VFKRFYAPALYVFHVYSEEIEKDFVIGKLLPCLIPFLSPGAEEEIRTEVMTVISAFTDTSDDACQFLISNCLTQLMLIPEAEEYLALRRSCPNADVARVLF